MTISPITEEKMPSLDDGPMRAKLRGTSRAGLIPLLAVLFTVLLGLFVMVDPAEPWIIAALTLLMGLGTDGIIRAHPQGKFHAIADTSPHLFVPVLFTLSAALFLEDVALGFWAVPAVLAAGLLMGAVLYAEHISVDMHDAAYPGARFVLNLATYLAAFGFFSVVYGFDVDLLPATIALGLVSTLLAVEIFRDVEADPIRALVFAAAIGVVVAEARWVLYFLPLDGFLAAVFLLLALYLTTGVISHYLTEHLSPTVMLEFALVTAAGLAIVVGGQVLS
jgi:hypothetical protein